VFQKYEQLIKNETDGWKLPKWYIEHCEWLMFNCHHHIMEEYLIFHDVGKPFCRTLDEQGRQHFPNHANVSAAVWRASGGTPLVADLMYHDMTFHTMKPSEAETFQRLDLAPTLLISALCEIHANAEMFGGIESTSFKIKFKNLERLGNRIINLCKSSNVFSS
jgi:hypothetical protein